MKKFPFAIMTASLGFVLGLGACSGDEQMPPEGDPAMAADEASSDLGPPPPADDPASDDTQASAQAATAAEPAEIEGITNRRLSFASDASSARVEGSITGYEMIDYLLNVRAGQAMNVSLATQNTATYFNILEPGETEVAVFNGSINENMFEGVAKESGDYRIRVYMMRSAARRDEKADYVLEVSAN